MSDLFGLELWRQYPEHYIIIATNRVDPQGNAYMSYHIVDVFKHISHIIEDQRDVRPLVAKMIEAGVWVVSRDEALKILYG